MHWLYFDGRSPGVLESAGFSYDSSVGYNDVVGYRAGTGQVFKLPGAERLLEIPLHIMDTAMFYPDYLSLSKEQAWELVNKFVRNAARDGGVLTFNWHDRSIAPERLWGDFYARVVDHLTASGAWFATAGQTASWFRKRRSVAFEEVSAECSTIRVRVPADVVPGLPPLRLKLHSDRWLPPAGLAAGLSRREIPLDGGSDVMVTRSDDLHAHRSS
jgi:hypothetical protein